MTYTPREIKDRVAVGDDIFIVEDLGDNRIKLIPSPTHVSEPGTPVNKALLQPIEDALGAITQKLSEIEAGAQAMNVIGGDYASIDNLFALAFNERTTSSSLTKIYESVLIGNIQGAIRVGFSLFIGEDEKNRNWNLQGRIYRNGAAVGTLRSASVTGSSSSTSSTPTYTEDIPGWKRGDRLQIYASMSLSGADGGDGVSVGLSSVRLRVDFV